MNFNVGEWLQRVLGGGAFGAADDHFERVARNASPEALRQGLQAMFTSDHTPPFAQMAAQLFGNANAQQQADMVNRLLGGMGPAIDSLLTSPDGEGLGGVLNHFVRNGANLSPEQAAALSPMQVQAMAEHAEVHNPGIVETMSGFFAQHPGLVKTMGASALTIALAKVAEHSQH